MITHKSLLWYTMIAFSLVAAIAGAFAWHSHQCLKVTTVTAFGQSVKVAGCPRPDGSDVARITKLLSATYPEPYRTLKYLGRAGPRKMFAHVAVSDSAKPIETNHALTLTLNDGEWTIEGDSMIIY